MLSRRRCHHPLERPIVAHQFPLRQETDHDRPLPKQRSRSASVDPVRELDLAALRCPGVARGDVRPGCRMGEPSARSWPVRSLGGALTSCNHAIGPDQPADEL